MWLFFWLLYGRTLRYKNKKEEIEDFFSNYNKYYGSKYRSAFRKDAINESN